MTSTEDAEMVGSAHHHATNKPSVKNLRAQFEQRAHLSQRKVFTPEQFFREQREAAEKEAQALLLARKKAAAFNMAMRQLELKQTMESAGGGEGVTPKQEEERAKLRKEARRLSVALRTIDEQTDDRRPVMQQQERRATHLLLASMAEEFEREMKKDDLEAIREEEEARERAAAAVEMAKQEEEVERKRRELETMAREMAEMARKQVEEDERVRREQEEKLAQQKAKEQKAKQEQEQLENEASQRDRLILTTYLRENYPEKLADVDELLKKFAGNLDVLFEELGKDQKFKEEEAEDADDEEENHNETTPTKEKNKSVVSHGGRSSVGATTVHSFRDDETVSPGKLQQQSHSQQQQQHTPKNEKSFLKPGVDLRGVISNFYSIYAASKVKDIDDILRHFDNRESDLFRTLEVKYDVTFSTDGTCVPSNGGVIGGEPFMEAPSAQGTTSKFAVDVQARQLKDKLAKQGQTAETVQAVLSSSSGMM